MKMKIEDIKLNPNNPRVIKDEKFKKLVQSIKEFPQMLELRPVVINKDNIVLGGNMRLKACKEAGLNEVPVIRAEDLTEDQQREFIIKDNIGYGEWDWSLLQMEWDMGQLKEWDLEMPGFDLDAGLLGTDFNLPNGEKPPFQQMTFTLADEQATIIKNALDAIKKTEDYKFVETYGNENSNGNALYLIIAEWEGQKK